MNRITKVVLGVLLVALVGAGCFYGGTLYGKGQAQPALPGAPGQAGTPPGGNGQASGTQAGMLMGQIETIGDGTLTMTNQNGSRTVVNVTDTTLIQKQASVALGDLQVGETVVVSGSSASDGSITARMVQVSSGDGLGLPDASPASGAGDSGSAGSNP
jgi:hypothetical protein